MAHKQQLRRRLSSKSGDFPDVFLVYSLALLDVTAFNMFEILSKTN